MSDLTAKTARLMRATDAVMEELDRQGVTEAMANLGFDPMQMADGIAPTDDPVLRFRSSSYAISHSRRQTEV